MNKVAGISHASKYRRKQCQGLLALLYFTALHIKRDSVGLDKAADGAYSAADKGRIASGNKESR